MTAPEMIDAAGRGELDLLFASGGNFLDVLPDPESVERTLGRIPLRVHMDIVLSSQMLVDPPPGGEVLLLPATTRYEIPGGVTETTTERRVILSPEIPGRGSARRGPSGRSSASWPRASAPSSPSGSASPTRPRSGARSPRWSRSIAGSRSCARAVTPSSTAARTCRTAGTSKPTDGKAHFATVTVPDPLPADGLFALSTRRGKQFNSMVQERGDAITGATREAVLIAAADAERLGLTDGDPVTLRSEIGELEAVTTVAPIAPGNLQVHWPEGNVLIGDRRSPEAEIPDYNARVEVLPG